MQSILVKQHVLEALSIHEEEMRHTDSPDTRKRRKLTRNYQSSSEESVSEGEEEEHSNQRKSGTLQKKVSQQEKKEIISSPKEDSELQFDMEGDQNHEIQNQLYNEEELLLDNYFKKINELNKQEGLPSSQNYQQPHQNQHNTQSQQQSSVQSQAFVDQQVQQLQQKKTRMEFQQKLEVQQKKVNDMKNAKEEELEKEKAMVAAQQLQKRTTKGGKIEEIQLNQEKGQEKESKIKQTNSSSKIKKQTAHHTPSTTNKRVNKSTSLPTKSNLPTFQTVTFTPSYLLVSPYDPMLGNQHAYSSSPVNKQGGGNSIDNSNEQQNLTDNYILRDLVENTSDIEPYDQGEDDDGEEDDPEALQELEKRREEIMEEFLEIAYQKKHEAVEEVKADCKKNKVPRDAEKKRVAEVQQALDQKRKEGMLEIKKKLNQIIMNDSITISDKMGRLGDTEYIRAFMQAYFNPPQPEEQQVLEEPEKQSE